MKKLIRDDNKKITAVTYNFFNLPQQITFSNGNKIVYLYDADGVKRQVVYTKAGTTKKMDYCGNMVYTDGVMTQVVNEQGYATFSGTTPIYHYYSINGTNVYSSGKHIGGREFNDIAIGEFDSPQQFLDSRYNTKGDKNDKIGSNRYGYTEGYIPPTTPNQDKIIVNEFKNISANREYGIISNNCATAVQKALEAVGIDTKQKLRIPANKYLGESSYTIKLNSFIPSIAFNTIIDNNPQGIYINKKNKR